MASESTVNPFDYVNAINAGDDIISTSDDPETAEAAYNAHLTNRALSYHMDAIMYVNDMNMRYDLDNKLQYLYYLYTLRPRRRYGKWHKTTPKKNIATIQTVFRCNAERAATVLSLLSKEQLKQIQDMASTSDKNNEPTTKIGQGKSNM